VFCFKPLHYNYYTHAAEQRQFNALHTYSNFQFFSRTITITEESGEIKIRYYSRSQEALENLRGALWFHGDQCWKCIHYNQLNANPGNWWLIMSLMTTILLRLAKCNFFLKLVSLRKINSSCRPTGLKWWRITKKNSLPYRTPYCTHTAERNKTWYLSPLTEWSRQNFVSNYTTPHLTSEQSMYIPRRQNLGYNSLLSLTAVSNSWQNAREKNLP
jgi:hypothetical protein